MARRRYAERLSGFDALRGLAALAVLLHHAWLTLPRAPGDGLSTVDWLLEMTCRSLDVI